MCSTGFSGISNWDGSPVYIPWNAAYGGGGSLVCVVSRDVALKRWGIPAILPAGFRSDGMSVPRLFWRWIGPKVEGHTVSPSIIHDFLYTRPHVCTRGEADRWLFRALRCNGLGRAKCAAVYAGVRIGGVTHWE